METNNFNSHSDTFMTMIFNRKWLKAKDSDTLKLKDKQQSRKFLAVYLVDKINPKKQKRQSNAADPHWDIPDCSKQFNNKPIFLDEKNALKYCRFKDESFRIFKLYVPESTIVGLVNHDDNGHHVLYLKNCTIRGSHIHGYFTKGNSEREYFKNPNFDETQLPA